MVLELQFYPNTILSNYNKIRDLKDNVLFRYDCNPSQQLLYRLSYYLHNVNNSRSVIIPAGYWYLFYIQ